ncbi:hypothetical protein K438DRAFT_1976581 [Mycena galopus ATCC 62051]|nr:hypothetical protein K438DRAFT_1976581 [Mycena galopus ATCC 62051]
MAMLIGVHGPTPPLSLLLSLPPYSALPPLDCGAVGPIASSPSTTRIHTVPIQAAYITPSPCAVPPQQAQWAPTPLPFSVSHSGYALPLAQCPRLCRADPDAEAALALASLTAPRRLRSQLPTSILCLPPRRPAHHLVLCFHLDTPRQHGTPPARLMSRYPTRTSDLLATNYASQLALCLHPRCGPTCQTPHCFDALFRVHVSCTDHSPSYLQRLVEEVTTDTSLFDSMLDPWAATDATHPFLAIVAKNAENPRLAILQRYLAMIHQDDQKGSRCVWCFTDPTLTLEEQTKDHSQHYVQHSQTRKKSTRATPADVEMGIEEIDAIKDALEAHAESCYGRLLALVQGEEEGETDVGESDDGLTVGKPDRASAAADSDVLMTRCVLLLVGGIAMFRWSTGLNSDVSMRSATSHRLIKSKQKKNAAIADGNDGARILSIQVPIAGTGHTKSGTRSRLHSLLFCPICLFDKSLSFCQRLIHFSNVPKLMDHFRTHWKKKDATEIDYKKTFICGLPPCIGTVEMDTGKYITHLHKQHDYKLIQCAKHCGASSTCDFQRCSEDHHNPSCFTLPKKFYHHNHALLLSDDRFPKKDRIAMLDATLVDYRKTDVMTRWYTWIFTKHKVSKEFTPKVLEKRRPKVVHPRTKPVSSTPMPVANPLHFLIRRCVAGVTQLHPEFAPIDVEKIINAIDTDMSLEQLSRLPKSRFPDCDFSFTIPAYTRFSAALKQWLVGAEMDECLFMLQVAFPGIITDALASKFRVDELMVYDFRDCLPADRAVYGLMVEEPVWRMISEAIDEWLEGRATKVD